MLSRIYIVKQDLKDSDGKDSFSCALEKTSSKIHIHYILLFSSVQFSRSVISNSLWPRALQHTRLPCPSPTPKAYSNSCPLTRGCHLTISFSVIPSPPALNLSQHQGLFQWVGSSHWVVKVVELQLQCQSFQWIFRVDFPLRLTGLIPVSH